MPSFCIAASQTVQLLNCVWLFETPWTAAQQASLPITNCWSLLLLILYKICCYPKSVRKSLHCLWGTVVHHSCIVFLWIKISNLVLIFPFFFFFVFHLTKVHMIKFSNSLFLLVCYYTSVEEILYSNNLLGITFSMIKWSFLKAGTVCLFIFNCKQLQCLFSCWGFHMYLFDF